MNRNAVTDSLCVSNTHFSSLPFPFPFFLFFTFLVNLFRSPQIYVYIHVYNKALYIIATNIRHSLPIAKSHAEQKHQQVSLHANCELAAEGSTAEGWKGSWKPDSIPLFFHSVKYRPEAQFNKVSIILVVLKCFRGKEPCCHFTFVSTLESTWLLISHCPKVNPLPKGVREENVCGEVLCFLLFQDRQPYPANYPGQV